VIARAVSLLAAATIGAGSSAALTTFEHHTNADLCADAQAINAIWTKGYYQDAEIAALQTGAPAPAAPTPPIQPLCK
jgi:acyl-coenzyme A synthetase/AMP-(fatty) acid ligase